MTSDRPTSSCVALAAPEPHAIDAAKAVLDGGGNVIDAAVAAAVSLAVAYPHMCSVGGDLIALVRDPRGHVTCINGTGEYGTGLDKSQMRALRSRGMPLTGPLTVTVPGAASGWAALLARGGSAPLDAVLGPAIHQAEAGVEVGRSLAAAIQADHAQLMGDPGMAATFLPEGIPLSAGGSLVQPALANTLRRLAGSGFTDLYSGEVSTDFSRGLKALGVPVTAEDLARHSALTVAPLATELQGLRVFTAPANSQGYMLVETLGALSILSPDGDLPGADSGLLAELFWGADVRRDEVLADPRWMTILSDGLTSPDALTRAAHEAASRLRGRRRVAAAQPRLRPSGDTIAVAAVDADGVAVSIIQSVFHAFGAGLLEPSTGIVLHNRGAFFSTDPDSPNLVAPGKRPAHTLMPVLVEGPGRMVAAHGTMGGKAQPQIHAQLLLRSLDGLSPSHTVSAPRFVVGGLDAGTSRDEILAEPGLPAAVLSELRGTRMPVRIAFDRDERVGHAMIARLETDGSLRAGADPRSDGSVLVR